MKKIFFLFSLFFICKNFDAQIPNANVSNGNVFDGEPFIAVSPLNHQHIVCAWMGYVFGNGSALTIRVKTSYDGGTNWTNAINMPHMSSTYKSADVSMAFDNSGKLFMSYIDYRESPDSGGVWVCNSLNEGLTWSTPVKIIDAYADGSKRPLDRPWLAVDPSGNKLFVTTKPAPWVLAPNRPYFMSSPDGGNTWSNWRYLDSTGFLVGNLIAAPMASVAFAGNSKVVTVYPSYLPSQSPFARMICAYSTSNGNSFSYKVMLNSVGGTVNDSAKLGYKVCINPADSNHIAFVSTSNSNGDYDIMLLESHNGGNMWTAPLRINDDPVSNNRMQDLPWIDFDTNGSLLITWRDRRNGGGGAYAVGTEMYYAYRNKDSLNFSANKLMSTNQVAYNNILSQNGNDFMGCVLRDDTLSAAWGDTRDGSLDIWFVRMKASTGIVSSVSLIESSNENLSVFPNPAAGVFQVKMKDGKVIENWQLISLDGKIIRNEKSNANTVLINSGDSPAGIYILQVSSGGQIHKVKIICP